MGAGYPPTFSLEEVEADHIRRVLATVHGHIGRAAERLGIHRNTLTRKMKEHGFDPGLAAGA
jgi:DNA-binding NtrC family response regulator